MTGPAAPIVVATALLGLGAVVVGWPFPRPRRTRLRRVVIRGAGGASGADADGDRAAATRWRGLGRAGGWWVRAWVDRAVRAPRGGGRWWSLPWLLVAGAVFIAGAAGGPVAAGVVAIYGLLAVRGYRRRSAVGRHREDRRQLLDLLSTAAADLRAGLPATRALPADPGADGDPRAATTPDARASIDGAEPLRARVRAAVALADRTGAPLADLLDRIVSDARARDRAGAAASAQAAGSRATAWLLAGLPAGGIALGYAIGVDPLAVLLHTPVGAASAFGAVALQLAGLAWTRRIVSTGEAT